MAISDLSTTCVGWGGAGDEVALGEVTAELTELVERREILDTLSDDAQPEGMAELDGRPDEVAVAVRVGGDKAGDEHAVQLELADGEVAQVGERGEAGTEVVYRDDEAKVVQLLDDGS